MRMEPGFLTGMEPIAAGRMQNGARTVPVRCAREDTRASGSIRWLLNYRSGCAPGRRALRNADGPRPQQPRKHKGARYHADASPTLPAAARRDVARSGARKVPVRCARKIKDMWNKTSPPSETTRCEPGRVALRKICVDRQHLKRQQPKKRQVECVFSAWRVFCNLHLSPPLHGIALIVC